MKSVIAALCALVSVGAQAGAITYNDLSVSQKNQVQSGAVVSVPKDVAGKPWPEVTAFIRMDSTPEEAAAVWADFNAHKQFLPKITKSQIMSQPDKATFLVAYTLDLPWPLSDENYTVRDHVALNGQAIVCDWNLVSADTTKESKGFAQFDTLGTGTLMTYYNFVVPGQIGAGAISGQAAKQVEEVAKALKTQVEKERAQYPQALQGQVAKLHTALGQ